MKLNELREHDVLEIQREALIEAALAVQTAYPRFRDNLELYAIINEKDPEMHSALKDFCAVYMNYFYFAKNLKNTKEHLSEIESTRYNQYIEKKDEARMKFTELLESRKLKA
ncbi:MAG TPA: hypothetical protein VNW99_12940 [Cytophagaceae bacterium]|jgi:hypothetical protein|nr:hypothetical protein [Cytophagaceae bacterium]